MKLNWLKKFKLNADNKVQFSLTVGGGLLGLAILTSVIMTLTAPKAEKKQAERMTPVVEAMTLIETNASVLIQSAGVITPINEVTLQAQVSGQITAKNSDFIEGGIVKSGDILIEIDDRDYQLAVKQKQAAVEVAKSELQLEEGRQSVALREWEILGQKNISDKSDKDLATRVPQMKSRQAAVKSAEAELEKAMLNLERTKLKAPFNGLVLSAEADIGDQAAPGLKLGRIVCTDAYWVQTPVPVDELEWISIPGATANISVPTGQTWNGTVVRLLGDVEPQGRLARVLIEINKPMENMKYDEITSPLLIDEFVSVSISGATIENICVIPRTAFRDGSEIWLLDTSNVLHITPIKQLWSDRERVFVRKTWAQDMQLITSDLATPVEGMTLRIADEIKQNQNTANNQSK